MTHSHHVELLQLSRFCWCFPELWHFSLQPNKHTVLPEDVAIDSVRVSTHLMYNRCSGMGASPSLLHSSLLLQAVAAAHKLKQKDKESILIRTGRTMPGKYQYYSGPVWLHSVLPYCFLQGFLMSYLLTYFFLTYFLT